jgi:hypothetical protein
MIKSGLSINQIQKVKLHGTGHGREIEMIWALDEIVSCSQNTAKEQNYLYELAPSGLSTN